MGHEIAGRLLRAADLSGLKHQEAKPMLFVGDDWAEDHHDVELVDEDGSGWPGAGCRKGWWG